MAAVANPNLVGTAEAAHRLGIERSTISRWVAAGRLTPAVKLAGPTGAMLFDAGAIDRLAAKLATEATS